MKAQNLFTFMVLTIRFIEKLTNAYIIAVRISPSSNLICPLFWVFDELVAGLDSDILLNFKNLNETF